MPDLRTAGLYAVCLLALATALPLSAQAQSFNCRYAKAPDEVAICDNDRLSGLDRTMSRLYFQLRNSLYGAERRRVEAAQRRWLQERSDCGSDTGCLVEAYERRIGELRDQ